MKRLMIFVLAVLIAAPMLPSAAFAANLSDAEGHWAEDAINEWSESGVLSGYEDGTFLPNNNIKRGEFFKIVNTVFDHQKVAPNPFSDLKESDWYHSHVLKLVGAGVVNGSGGAANAEANITREQAFSVLARAFKIPADASGVNAFGDASAISDWAVPEIGGMAAAGYIQGNAGNLNPSANLTRAEAVQVLDNIIAAYYSAPGTYGDTVDGIALVNTADVILDGAAIGGDLYVTPGVKTGNFSIDNSEVSGFIRVSGGGPDSVSIGAGVKAKGVIVDPDEANGTLRLYVADGASVGTVSVAAGASAVTLEGTFASLDIGGASSVTLGDAKVETLQITGPDAALTVSGKAEVMAISVEADNVSVATESGAKVTEITVAANNATVSGNGTVGTVSVESGDGNTVTVHGAKLAVSEGAGAVDIGGGLVAESGTTAVVVIGSPQTPAAAAGGGGGGGNTTTPTVDHSDKHADYDEYTLTISHLAGLTFAVVITDEDVSEVSVTADGTTKPAVRQGTSNEWRVALDGDYGISEIKVELTD